jgi:hypothetical protein
MSKKGQGWFGESHRHSLASRGIKSGQKNYGNSQKVPWKEAKKIQSIELKDDNTIEEKMVEQEDKPKEKNKEEEKTDELEEEPKPTAIKKGILIDTYENEDNE